MNATYCTMDSITWRKLGVRWKAPCHHRPAQVARRQGVSHMSLNASDVTARDCTYLYCTTQITTTRRLNFFCTDLNYFYFFLQGIFFLCFLLCDPKCSDNTIVPLLMDLKACRAFPLKASLKASHSGYKCAVLGHTFVVPHQFLRKRSHKICL